MHTAPIRLVECPRDAMQGWPHPISTQNKVRYINSLLQVGFDTIDFGSFVSAKAIPQMADTREVIRQLAIPGNGTNLLAIVANERGAEEAVLHAPITHLGFPFSVSPTFQLRNTNSTQEESLNRVDAIQELCIRNNKELVVYLSMGFGNPYGDVYNEEILLHWAEEMIRKEIGILSLADTVGLASPAQVSTALSTLIPQYPGTSIGVHLHSSVNNWEAKARAAWDAGCTRFDGALKGIGGCPMAQDDLIGNMDSLQLVDLFASENLLPGINQQALQTSLQIANEIFV